MLLIPIRRKLETTRTALQLMLAFNDQQHLNDYIPSQAQIDAGRAYWTQEKTKIATQEIPYWQGELAKATQENTHP